MSKTRKALQVSALLSAVSGATLAMSVGSATVHAAEAKRVEEQCWHRQPMNPDEQYRMRGCVYEQYPLQPGDGGDIDSKPARGGGGGGGGKTPSPGYTA